MREHKFRVWDGREMFYNPYIPNHGKWAMLDETIKDCQDNYKALMQYTGLKDKKGTEIYEGDILRHPAKDEWEKINYTSFEVFFHDNDSADSHVGFQFNRLHFHGSIAGYSMYERFLPSYTQKMEVIGNIHQHPELLTHKQ